MELFFRFGATFWIIVMPHDATWPIRRICRRSGLAIDVFDDGERRLLHAAAVEHGRREQEALNIRRRLEIRRASSILKPPSGEE